MLVVIEGVDRTGKSTLCELLRTQLGGVTMHWGAPQASSSFEEYVEPVQWYQPGCGRNLFIDRHYLGETVWPKIFDRAAIMSVHDQKMVERYLNQLGAVGVIATRDEISLEMACSDEPSAGRAVRAQSMFQHEIRHSAIDWFSYEHMNPGDIHEIIYAAKTAEKEATW